MHRNCNRTSASYIFVIYVVYGPDVLKKTSSSDFNQQHPRWNPINPKTMSQKVHLTKQLVPGAKKYTQQVKHKNYKTPKVIILNSAEICKFPPHFVSHILFIINI